MNHFSILMQLLRDRDNFWIDISKEVRLEKKIVGLLICNSVFFAIYGGIIGSFHSWLQMFASAVKLPALYLITLIICLPTLYFFDLISGSQRSFGQYLALLLSSMSIISVMLFCFAPITLLFRLSINDYEFFKLFNVFIFAVTGFIGINFFYRAMLFLNEQDTEKPKYRNSIFKGWLVLYAFVGSQLGWTLRPFFGTLGKEFELFRDIEGNVYVHLFKVISHILGFK